MLQATYHMVQKAVFQITASSKLSCSLLEMLQGCVYDFVRKDFSYDADWSKFCGYGQTESIDQRVKAQTALYKQDDNSSVRWALRLKVRDMHYRRRTWLIQIAIHVEQDSKATLCYAEMYNDHLAGSFLEMKPPLVSIPSLFLSLLSNTRLSCRMGQSPLPREAIALDMTNVRGFIDMVLDHERHIPIVLISCPDLVNPSEVARVLLGNAAVGWLDETRVFEEIHDALIGKLSLTWDSVQVLMPFTLSGKTAYHPVLKVSDINRYGHTQVLAMLRQAYCTCMRSDESKDFMTVENIYQKRDQDYLLTLRSYALTQEQELSKLKKANDSLSTELGTLRVRYENETSEKLKDEVASLEALLNESISQSDSVTHDIQTIIQQLYACMGKGFIPIDSKNDFLLELQHAISVCFARLGGSR